MPAGAAVFLSGVVAPWGVPTCGAADAAIGSGRRMQSYCQIGHCMVLLSARAGRGGASLHCAAPLHPCLVGVPSPSVELNTIVERSLRIRGLQLAVDRTAGRTALHGVAALGERCRHAGMGDCSRDLAADVQPILNCHAIPSRCCPACCWTGEGLLAAAGARNASHAMPCHDHHSCTISHTRTQRERRRASFL